MIDEDFGPCNSPLHRISVVGTGAIGGYYGSLLARAGEDVHLLVRSDYESVKTKGLTIKYPNDDSFNLRVQAYNQAQAIGPCDLVIIATKTTDNRQLLKILPHLIANNTTLLIFQNGLGNVEFFAEHFGLERIIGVLCFICLNRVGPGIIKNSYPGYLSIGELNPSITKRTLLIANKFEKAGVKVILSESLQEALWRKLFWNIPFNGLSIAAGGITTDKIMADKTLKHFAFTLMKELQKAAAAYGCNIPDSFIQRQFNITPKMGDYKPSSLVDYLNHREVEIEAIFGEPLRRGQKAGVSMPQLQKLYKKLKHICIQ
jgi:2-dehydropantoate 2-reductase